MIGPQVDWPGIIDRVEEMIRKEESHLQYLVESKCDPVRITRSRTVLIRYRDRLETYKLVIGRKNDRTITPSKQEPQSDHD